MKTRNQKVISILACVLLLASFFAFPVYAASPTSSTFSINVTEPQLEDFRILRAGQLVSTAFDISNTAIFSDSETANTFETDRDIVTFTYDWIVGNQGVVSLWLGMSTFTSDPITSDTVHTYSINDTVWLEPGSFIAFTDEQQYVLTKYRFVLRESNNRGIVGAVVAATDPIDCRIAAGVDDPITFDDVGFKFLESVSCQNLSLCLEFYGSSLDSVNLNLGFFEDSFIVNYGAGFDPNYPIYPSAPGGNVGNLDSTEQELVGSSEEGVQEGLNKINPTSFNNAFQELGVGNVAPFRFISLMNRFLTIPSIDGLITISIGLGLFASLFALVGSIVSAKDRKAASEARAAARQEYREHRRR